MKINKAQRAAARHKKTEAVDSFLEHQKDEPVHSYSDSNKTLHRSGVVVRNDKNVGREAMQRARELLNSVNGPILSRPRTSTGTNDTWFKNNQLSVEQQIGERISVDKNPQVQRDESLDEKVNRLVDESYENMPVEHYHIPDAGKMVPIEHCQPPVDDDEPGYVPLSER